LVWKASAKAILDKLARCIRSSTGMLFIIERGVSLR
jgi:hypothetical protein